MHLDALHQQIDDHIDGHPGLRKDAELIGTIPGLGAITIAKLLAYVADVRRFRNAKALAAFIGVTPRLRLSGSSVKGRSMLSRTGHTEMRRALYMPWLVALRHNPSIRVFGERLRAQGLAPRAVVGAAMRMRKECLPSNWRTPSCNILPTTFQTVKIGRLQIFDQSVFPQLLQEQPVGNPRRPLQ